MIARKPNQAPKDPGTDFLRCCTQLPVDDSITARNCMPAAWPSAQKQVSLDFGIQTLTKSCFE